MVPLSAVTWGTGRATTNVAIPKNNQGGTGYLGVKYAALATGKTPTPGIPFSVRGMTLDGSLTVSDVERRQMLLEDSTSVSTPSRTRINL